MLKKTFLASSMLLAATAMAETTAPNTFTSGTAISASEMNANFDAMEAGINTNADGIATNASDISSINAAITSLTTAVNNLQTQVDGLSSGGSSVDLQAYVGTGVYQMVWRDQFIAQWGSELCVGEGYLVFNSNGTLEDGVKDENGTPDDESDDVLISGTRGESLCIETYTNGDAPQTEREAWVDIGASWALNGQTLTLTFIEQMENVDGNDLWEDQSSAELYSRWGAINNAGSSQFYDNIWQQYIEPNGYHAQWTDNGDGSQTVEIWTSYDSFSLGDPAAETWTQGEIFFYSADDALYTGDVGLLTEKLGPVAEDFMITADGNVIVKQIKELDGGEHSSELIIGIRVGSNQ